MAWEDITAGNSFCHMATLTNLSFPVRVSWTFAARVLMQSCRRNGSNNSCPYRKSNPYAVNRKWHGLPEMLAFAAESLLP
jgi:hypothetical protein